MKNSLTMMLLLLFLICFYKTPILDSTEAVLKAEKYLNSPPLHSYTAQMNVDVMELTAEQIQTRLYNQTGIFNRIFNRKQWQITLQFENRSPTVVIDAYNGHLIEIIGATN